MGTLIRWLAVALVAFGATAQVRETITVEVVDVPVYVLDANGKAIRGLPRDAFTLLIDGKAKPIEYFDVMDFGVAPHPQSAPQTQRERRLYLLLFDLDFSQPARLAQAQKAAEKAIDQSNPTTDLFSVATYHSSRGVFFVTPFLLDRVAIKRALFTLRGSTARDALGLTITKDERDAWKDVTDPIALETVMGGEANQEMAYAQVSRLVEDLFDGVAEAATRLGTMPGQKHVLLFTQGYESTLLHGFGMGPGPPKVDARLFSKLDAMDRKFRAAGVILDTVDIAGLRHSWDYRDNDALWQLARGTGGQVVHNKNDLVAAIGDLTTSQQIVYVLGFRRTDNRPHRIDVRVNGIPRGSSLFYRTGFGDAQKPAVDGLQLADILLNDIPQTGLNMRLNASPSELAIELPRAEITAQLLEKTPTVDVIVYAFDEKGSAVFAGQKTINFDRSEREGKQPIVIRQHLDLPPGHYVAKAIARITGTSSLGFARAEFTVSN